MINISNSDNSFFSVESADTAADIITKDVIGINITEELYKMAAGNIRIRDNNFYYSRAFRMGQKLSIAWGYDQIDTSPTQLLQRVRNPGEYSGDIRRRGFTAMVTSVNGEADEGGNHTLTVKFVSLLDLNAEKKHKVYSSGTRSAVVFNEMLEMGLDVQIVNFRRGNEILSANTALRKSRESHYRFLLRIAREWRALFRVSNTANGGTIGIFIDPEKVGTLPFLSAQISGATGLSHLYEYGSGIKNVISYNWENIYGLNGGGDNVRLVFINGKPETVRTTAEKEKVVTWRLNMDKLKAELKRRKKNGFSDLIKMKKEILNAKDFDEVKRFWEPITYSTAPQGAGYKLNLTVFGNPLSTVPNIAKFGDGFPFRLDQPSRTFYLKKVDHVLAQKYLTNIECVDVIGTLGVT